MQTYKTHKIPTKVLDPKCEETIDIFPASFIGLLIGSQGSGKTHLLFNHILKEKELLGKKFALTIICSPSPFPDSDSVKKNNLFTNFDVNSLHERLYEANENALNVKRKCDKPMEKFKILVVLDDLVTQIKTLEKDKQFNDLLVLRRHCYSELDISYIIVS